MARLRFPLGAFFGPIFQKEVRSAGRRRATYILRCGYVLGLLAIVSFAFMAAGDASHLSPVQRMQELQTLAPVLTSVAMWFQFVAMVLIPPLLAAPVICDERRARSLETLLTTPLRAREIILGKLSSRIVQLAILTLLVAPILLAVRIFGGIEGSFVIAFTCVALTLGALGASLGVLYSIWHRRATSAALFALLTLILVQGGPTALEAIRFYIVTEVFDASITPVFNEQIAATASPYALFGLQESIAIGSEIPWTSIQSEWLYFLVGSYMDPQGIGAPSVVPIVPVWVTSSLYNLAVAAIVMQIAIVMLRRTMRKELDQSPAQPRRKRPKAPREGQEPAPAPDPEEITRTRERTVSDRPVLWRELRRTGIGSRRMRIAIGVITIAGMALIYALAGVHNEGLQMTMAVLGSLIVMCQVIFMTTGGIATEREARTWDVLLTTPLTGREIVLGKFWGSLRSQWFLPTVVLAHFTLSVLLDAMPWFYLPQIVLILAGPIFFFSATGQFFSLAIRKGITGAVLNLLLAMTLWMGIWVGFALYMWMTSSGDDEIRGLMDAAYSINPLMMAGSAAEPVSASHFVIRTRWTTANLDYDMLDNTKGFAAFNAWLVGAFIFYVAAGAAILSLTINTFQSLSGRSS